MVSLVELCVTLASYQLVLTSNAYLRWDTAKCYVLFWLALQYIVEYVSGLRTHVRGTYTLYKSPHVLKLITTIQDNIRTREVGKVL